jgi:2-methylcitrate dehydratase PrpD
VLKAFSDASNPAALTAQLGEIWHLESNVVKPYSCCGSTHCYVDAAFRLRQKLGTPWDANRRVRVGMSRVVDVQCGFDYAPGSALNAQMSLRYVVAAALMEGQALPQQFSDEKIADPAIVTLAGKLELVHDPRLDELYPTHFAGWIAADFGGEWVRVDILDPTGSPAAPIDARGVTEKFRGINARLPADRIAEVALHIENHSVRELLGLLAAK